MRSVEDLLKKMDDVDEFLTNYKSPMQSLLEVREEYFNLIKVIGKTTEVLTSLSLDDRLPEDVKMDLESEAFSLCEFLKRASEY